MEHIPPFAFQRARIELHYAAQVVAACADARLQPLPDDSHTAMRWEAPRMLGAPSPNGIAIGVDCHALAIVDLRRGDTFPLKGRTLADALRWADDRYGGPSKARLRDYDLPPSPLREGSAFVCYPDELRALTRWYQLGQEVLESVHGADRILIWPHHFDIGTIVDGIGLGMSPGDQYYDEPYFYVTAAAEVRVPELQLGHWHTDRWRGAVLTATAMAGEPRLAYSFVASTLGMLR